MMEGALDRAPTTTPSRAAAPTPAATGAVKRSADEACAKVGGLRRRRAEEAEEEAVLSSESSRFAEVSIDEIKPLS